MDIQIVEERLTNPTVIKVVGAGGGGSNAVNRMIEVGVQNVEFIAANTDLQSLSKSNAPIKLGLGAKLTNGLGAGGKPEVGEKAAMEDKSIIENALKGANMVFITAGMGGGTGTGAAPIIAEVSKSLGILTVGVVTRPFNFEGKFKHKLAEQGIAKLREVVDTLIIIPNQNLFKIAEKKTSVIDAFKLADDVLRQGVQSISDLITITGEINIDFADVKTTMEGRGDALMGIGYAKGDNRAVEAATKAINNPLLEDAKMDGAMNVLVNVRAGVDFSLFEYEEVVKIITNVVDEDALIIMGLVKDDTLEDGVIVSVIATGYKEQKIPHQISRENQNAQSDTFFGVKDFENLVGGGMGASRIASGIGGLQPRSTDRDDLEVPTYLRNLNSKN